MSTMTTGANSWTKRGVVFGTFGTVLAFVAIHIDRIVADRASRRRRRRPRSRRASMSTVRS
jgi:hypothetical protein